jgi:hypothetical protein
MRVSRWDKVYLDHWVLKPANVLKWFQEILGWLHTWTNDTEQHKEWTLKRKERVAAQENKETQLRQHMANLLIKPDLKDNVEL